MINTSHLHPMIVHFPIAVIMIGFLADLLSMFLSKGKSLSKMGFYLQIVGMLAAIAAFVTGYLGILQKGDEAEMLRESHELFATFTLISIILATFFRILLVYHKKEESPLKYIALSLFFFAFIFVVITGYLGGTLVYSYMVGSNESAVIFQ
ncbi:MAG: DUF2231 domain-containing protein [Deltaproteobacteria bacterium]|nr:DUF2231 domain-containing protein [Deltaproteobacteria bacterium]